jgi:hypothetical protein
MQLRQRIKRTPPLIHVAGQTACVICGGNKIHVLIRLKTQRHQGGAHGGRWDEPKEPAMRHLLVLDDDLHVGLVFAHLVSATWRSHVDRR